MGTWTSDDDGRHQLNTTWRARPVADTGGMSKTQEGTARLLASADRATTTERDFRCEPSVGSTGPANIASINGASGSAEQLPMKFALVETSRSAPAGVAAVEVILASGERLRIVPGIDAATLRLVLSVLREQR